MEKKRSRWGGDSSDEDDRTTRKKAASAKASGSSAKAAKAADATAAAAAAAVASAAATPVVAPVAVKATPAHVPLLHGCRSVENYIRMNHIDEGTYGVVFRARDKETGDVYALKQVRAGWPHHPLTAQRRPHRVPVCLCEQHRHHDRSNLEIRRRVSP